MLLVSIHFDDTNSRHLNFPVAPVYIQDIKLLDPTTLDTFVIDGIIGMNYLMTSFREFFELFGDFNGAPATLGVFISDLGIEPLP